MLIDTHCHLNFKVFENSLDKVIKRAKKAGVTKIIIPGAKLDSSKKAVEIAQKYDGVYAAVGIHPIHADKKNKKLSACNALYGKANEDIKILKGNLEKLAKNKKVVAIGECGLDYHRIENDELKVKKIQKEIFKMHIKLAQKLNLPLIIHNRNASNDILKVLNTKYQILNTIRAVFHCFSGNFSLLKWAIDNNFYIGIDGNVTYSNHVKKVVKKTPLDRILIETDSPFLMPESLRKTKKWPNEPKNVKIIANEIAKIKGDSFLKIAKQTSENAKKLFWKK